MDITTGTLDIMQLADANGTLHDVYLGVDGNNNQIVPVPKYFWKIVQHQDSQNATVFVVINNPHLKRVEATDIFCRDVCRDIRWVNWPTRNINRGYMFCCSVDGIGWFCRAVLLSQKLCFCSNLNLWHSDVQI